MDTLPDSESKRKQSALAPSTVPKWKRKKRAMVQHALIDEHTPYKAFTPTSLCLFSLMREGLQLVYRCSEGEPFRERIEQEGTPIAYRTSVNGRWYPFLHAHKRGAPSMQTLSYWGGTRRLNRVPIVAYEREHARYYYRAGSVLRAIEIFAAEWWNLPASVWGIFETRLEALALRDELKIGYRCNDTIRRINGLSERAAKELRSLLHIANCQCVILRKRGSWQLR